MKLSFVFTLLLQVTHLIGNTSVSNEDSTKSKKPDINFECMYVYNVFQGHRQIELLKGGDIRNYVNFRVTNAGGYSIGCNYSHSFTNRYSIQIGLSLMNRNEIYTHSDSIHNSAGSPLAFERFSSYNVDVLIHMNYTLNRFVLLSGLMLPTVSYSYSSSHYQDQSLETRKAGYNWANFYFSERLHILLLRKAGISLSMACAFSPDFIQNLFSHHSGYNVLLNGGFVWVLNHSKKLP
jgi:hypothetical protein